MGKMRILVIDDIPQMRRILRRMLGGHEVVECKDGSEALNVLLGDDSFDVILSDMDMGVMDGESFFEALTEHKPELSDRVVFVTGGGATLSQSRFLSSTSRPVVSKPFRSEDLNHAISSIGVEMSHG